MKLNRRYSPPYLWAWMRNRIPAGLETKEIRLAYSVSCNIYRKGEAPGFLASQFTNGDPVANVLPNEIVLHNPEWFSDFEDLLRSYEAQTGIETTLTYWQSPKDAPAASYAAPQTVQEKK